MSRILSGLNVCLIVLVGVFCVLASQAGAESYAYDKTGRLIGVSYADGTTITYIYDAAGNLLLRKVTTLVDSDGNNIDDEWEVANFGSSGVEPEGDADGDGSTNLEEFLAETNPNDPDDYLRVSEFTIGRDSGFSIEWTAVPGKLYRVQYTDTLSPLNWRNLPGDLRAGSSTMSITDTSAPEAAQRYYRVVILQ